MEKKEKKERARPLSLEVTKSKAGMTREARKWLTDYLYEGCRDWTIPT